MNDNVASVDSSQRGGAGESKSEQVLRRPSGKYKPRVVIVGGGFAGVAAAKSLRGCHADVTLIDLRNHHIFQPLLYQVATALLAPSEVTTPIRHRIRSKSSGANLSIAEAALFPPNRGILERLEREIC
jgi:NADH dehydrogenase